ncbi:MAG: glycosyltransferase family 2 protein [Candidatus Nitrohelix vancouverensis]|uniref:Glycosyltransferase family 2 protein n=1 Tax=Candidatus Nitrohelix vancouverensis TaxID=2705534 RepID=A0A7T0C2M3_9BACT|nr:MAG: glycosyltransferase family 2 protein [Candidatus Nitrohelix vancouverensis]
MSDADKLAVIIVNWNSGAYLRQCLEALANQSRTPDRVLVVDNASSDDSASSLLANFPKVEFLFQKDNLGFAAGNNLAVSMASDCRWVAFLNPDAFPEPDWLEALLRAAADHPECSSFGSRMRMHGTTDLLDGTGDVYHISGMAWRRDHGVAESATDRQAGEIFSPCAAAALFSREAFLEAGGFDVSYFCYFEDVDLGFRLRLAGRQSYYVKDAIVSHVGSGTTARDSDFAVYHGARNLVWTYVKNMPGYLFWVYLPQHLAANIAALVWYSLRGQTGTIIKAKCDALAGLPRIWKERQVQAKLRKISMSELRRMLKKGWVLPYSKAKRGV